MSEEKRWCICCGYRGWVLDVDANNQPRRVSCWRCAPRPITHSTPVTKDIR